MTYTIYGHCNELTLEQCKRADREIASGMIEHVFDDVVAFHDLALEDVAAGYNVTRRGEYLIVRP